MDLDLVSSSRRGLLPETFFGDVYLLIASSKKKMQLLNGIAKTCRFYSATILGVFAMVGKARVGLGARMDLFREQKRWCHQVA